MNKLKYICTKYIDALSFVLFRNPHLGCSDHPVFFFFSLFLLHMIPQSSEEIVRSRTACEQVDAEQIIILGYYYHRVPGEDRGN